MISKQIEQTNDLLFKKYKYRAKFIYKFKYKFESEWIWSFEKFGGIHWKVDGKAYKFELIIETKLKKNFE